VGDAVKRRSRRTSREYAKLKGILEKAWEVNITKAYIRNDEASRWIRNARYTETSRNNLDGSVEIDTDCHIEFGNNIYINIKYPAWNVSSSIFYADIRNWKETRNSCKAESYVIDIATPCIVCSTSLVCPISLFLGGNFFPPAFELPDCGLVHHDVTQTRDYHNKWQWEAHPSRLFFIIYCDPFLTSRKPFTNSFNLFPGLLFISVFIC
jgi:hypothetical protein